MTTIIHNNKERSRVNNLGEPIADSEEKLIEFWDWFEDSAIVDNNGCPVVLFKFFTSDESAIENLANTVINSKPGLFATTISYKEVFRARHYLKANNLYNVEHTQLSSNKLHFRDNFNQEHIGSLNLLCSGYDAATDITKTLFMGLNDDSQFKLASTFNLKHAPVVSHPELIWNGKTVQPLHSKWLYRAVVGKVGDDLYPGHQVIRQGPDEVIDYQEMCFWVDKCSDLTTAKKNAVEALLSFRGPFPSPTNESDFSL